MRVANKISYHLRYKSFNAEGCLRKVAAVVVVMAIAVVAAATITAEVVAAVGVAASAVVAVVAEGAVAVVVEGAAEAVADLNINQIISSHGDCCLCSHRGGGGGNSGCSGCNGSGGSGSSGGGSSATGSDGGGYGALAAGSGLGSVMMILVPAPILGGILSAVFLWTSQVHSPLLAH